MIELGPKAWLSKKLFDVEETVWSGYYTTTYKSSLGIKVIFIAEDGVIWFSTSMFFEKFSLIQL